MTDKSQGVGGPQEHGHTPKTKHASKKDFDHTAANSTDSKEHEGKGLEATIRKMLPGISDDQVKKFVSSLYNAISSEFKRAADRSKEAARKWKEDDQS